MKRTLEAVIIPNTGPHLWEEDARRMAETGLTWVRIGEFAWSRLEPKPGNMRSNGLMRRSQFWVKRG